MEPRAAKPVDDDEDIFGDAGRNYEPELPASRASNGPAMAQASGSYFDKKDDMSDLPPLPKAGLHPHKTISCKESKNLQSKGGSRNPHCALVQLVHKRLCVRRVKTESMRKAGLRTLSQRTEPTGNGHAAANEDMEIEEGETLHPPPPPPPVAPGGPNVGPARPPADYDAATAYADPAAYEAYMQSSIAYQASLCYRCCYLKQQAVFSGCSSGCGECGFCRLVTLLQRCMQALMDPAC